MKAISKKSLLFVMIGLLLAELIMPLLGSGKAQAAVLTGAWVDGGTIIIGSASGSHATYSLDSNGNYVYSPPVPGSFIPIGQSTCPNTISIVQVAEPAD